MPIAEDCTKSDDEDCDGVSCSELAWAKLTGDTGVQSLVGVATDANDNVFVAGKFEGTIDFGGQPLTTTAADGELFVAKLDPAGSVVWAKKFGSVAVWDIATDSGGNVILVGSYDNAGQFGTIGLPTPSQNFVAKVSSAGAALWAKSFPRKSSFYPTVAVGPSDGIVVAHGLDANGGNSTVISVRGFDASGAAGASQNFPSSATSAWAYPSDVAVDASGNVFVTASFQSKLLIGTQDLTSAGKDDVVSFKLSQAFTPLWALQFGGPGVDRSVQIAVDRSTGNVAVVGEFEATAEFAGASMTAVSSSDVYLVSATNGGTVTWRKQFGALTSPWPQAIAIDQAGNIAISGSAPSAVDFGGGEVSGAFLAKFTPSGDHVWSKGFGTQSLGWALATDSKDNLLLGGTATDPIDFGAGLLTPKGQGDAFVAKFAP